MAPEVCWTPLTITVRVRRSRTGVPAGFVGTGEGAADMFTVARRIGLPGVGGDDPPANRAGPDRVGPLDRVTRGHALGLGGGPRGGAAGQLEPQGSSCQQDDGQDAHRTSGKSSVRYVRRLDTGIGLRRRCRLSGNRRREPAE